MARAALTEEGAMVLEEEDRGGGVGGVADAEADAKPSADAGREEGADAKCGRRRT